MATPTVRSVHKAFRLLQSFQDPMEQASSAELGRRAGLSDAAAHRMLRTLADIGVVVRHPRGRWRLNPYFRFVGDPDSTSAPALRLIANPVPAISKTS